MLNDVLSIVFSRIKNKYPTKLKTKFPQTFFTTSNRVPKEPQFPTVYVRELGGIELGQDFDGTTLNAIRTSIRIEVTDNESMENVSEVMNYVVDTMKSMHFSLTSIPIFLNDNDVYRKIATFNRVIGANDKL